MYLRKELCRLIKLCAKVGGKSRRIMVSNIGFEMEFQKHFSPISLLKGVEILKLWFR